MNISIIIRLAWNQFRCLVQYSVHKRIIVSSEQGQGKNKQMFEIGRAHLIRGALVNISIIIRLSWNQLRCLVQYSVHKRITVSSEQGQGKNKQMFVVNFYL